MHKLTHKYAATVSPHSIGDKVFGVMCVFDTEPDNDLGVEKVASVPLEELGAQGERFDLGTWSLCYDSEQDNLHVVRSNWGMQRTTLSYVELKLNEDVLQRGN